ncbi:MAG: bifunctional folylpolyglutamate synthase/dihydrofolate synthase [Candidatus Bathyarchaeia archaeon]
MGQEVSGFSESDYRDVVEWVFGLHRFGSRPGLANIRHLLSLLGDPQNNFRSVHVTGTNGKGSTTAFIASILESAGYKVGLFTSPHLSSFTERIRVNGEEIPPSDVVRILSRIRPLAEGMMKTGGDETGLRHPTFFEVITAAGFEYFSEKDVDFAVLEAGMGGRLDATNVVDALVSVITNVGLEHTEVLGDTVLEIAEKKVGIIKKGGVLVTATADDEVFSLFREVCRSKGSRIIRVDEDIRYRRLSASLEGQSLRVEGLNNTYPMLHTGLLGKHQLRNAATAVGAIEALGVQGVDISPEAVKEGVRRTRWPGRLEVVQRSPLVVLDCAKDADAARAVKEAIMDDFVYDRLIAVVSISSDKHIPGMIGELAQAVDTFILTAHGVMGRAAESTKLAREVERNSRPYIVVEDVREAVQKGIEMAEEGDMVLVTGSVFLVGEARERWFKPEHPDPI